MNAPAQAVARCLLQIKAIKLNPEEPFTWASGILSPIYCDNRLLLSNVSERELVHGLMREVVNSHYPHIDAVAGVATAGIPHAAVLAHLLGKPMLYVRSQPKSHGRKNLIEGSLMPGWRVLLVEDLISTGGSSLKAVESLREAGGQVAGVLAIFTYGFAAARRAFAAAGCPLATLTDFDTLAAVAAQEGFVDKAQISALTEWRDRMH